MYKISLATFFFFVGSLLFVMMCSSVLASSELVENSWNTKMPMNQARWNLGVVVVEGKIYAIGGRCDTGFLDINECYDSVMDTWVTLKPIPTARSGFAIAVYEGKIYCIGGTTGIKYPDFLVNPYEPPAPVHSSVNEVYDPNTNSWSTKASMPISGAGLQAYVIDGKIFVLDEEGNLFNYDPTTDAWTKKTSAPILKYSNGTNGFFGFSTMLDNNKILVYTYLYNYQEYSSKFVSYNPKTDKWSDENSLAFMAESSNSSELFKDKGYTGITSGVYAPQRIYVFSTNILGSASNEVLVYDLVYNNWLTAKGMSANRSDFGVVVVDDVFYVIGGFIDGSTTPACATNEQYVPIGYHSNPYTPKPTVTLSKPDDSHETFVIYLTVAVLAIIVGIVTIVLFFHFLKLNTPLHSF
jgi:hypothetical protein